MTKNSSISDGFMLRQANHRVIGVQVLVTFFFFINMLLIVTFFKTKSLHTSARYLIFALMLLSDSFLLLMSDIMLILAYFEVTMQVWLCVLVSAIVLLYNMLTPVTLTAMTLERYVAICMPLRHGELCSVHSTVHCILVIHAVSSIPCFVTLFMFFASASMSIYTKNMVCSVEIFILRSWQSHLRSALSQFFFFVMVVVIVFCYYKILKVAKSASGENKTSTQKGLRTVILHGFQLILCLIQLCCPFIEAAVFQLDYNLFISVRYFNYVVFVIASRCLSPLIYGLRDETFCLSIKKTLLAAKS